MCLIQRTKKQRIACYYSLSTARAGGSSSIIGTHCKPNKASISTTWSGNEGTDISPSWSPSLFGGESSRWPNGQQLASTIRSSRPHSEGQLSSSFVSIKQRASLWRKAIKCRFHVYHQHRDGFHSCLKFIHMIFMIWKNHTTWYLSMDTIDSWEGIDNVEKAWRSTFFLLGMHCLMLLAHNLKFHLVRSFHCCSTPLHHYAFSFHHRLERKAPRAH